MNKLREEIRHKLNNLSDEILNKINEIINDNTKSDNEGYLVPNKLYKHINNTDVAFYIMSVGFTDNSVMCRGYWMNIVNPDKKYFIKVDSITIDINDIQNWKEINE